MLLAALCNVFSYGQSPATSFDFGFEQRVRNENWNNILDFDDAADDELRQIRYRTRMWIKTPVTTTIDAFVGLGQETWQVVIPRRPYRFDEVIFETGYLDFKRLFTDGLSLRVGRQNLMKGEGFLMLDGGTYDGSRAIYFNAVNLAYVRNKSKIEFLVISNPMYDRYLPRIHDKHRKLTEWQETAYGVYFTNTSLKRTVLDAYYFHKRENGDVRAATDPQYLPDRYTNSFGARINRQLGETWQLNGEFAVQQGSQRPSVPVSGYGGYTYLRKSFHAPGRPAVTGGYWGFSGDNPATASRYEGWNPLFARWPKWSEMYLYSLWKERGAGYWSNLGMWEAELAATPVKWLNLRATYYHMNSFHSSPFNPNIFADGTGRGNHYQGRMDFLMGPSWKAHIVYESLLPGDFYRARGMAYFFRWEICYQFQKRWAAEPLAPALSRMLR